MNRIKQFLKSERGDAEVIEAAILYPLTFMVVFLMIYIGLYILQMMTISAYAQKVALLAAREVASPGYSTLLESSRYSTSAAEADFNINSDDDTRGSYKNKIHLDNKVTSTRTRAYRYWGTLLDEDDAEYYEKVLEDLVKYNSVITGGEGHSISAEITCHDCFISQFIDVKVTQNLMRFPVLDYFGIQNPSVSATATATISDTDELVRNVDFATDALDALARHFGIDINEVKGKFTEVAQKFGLIN